MSRVVHDFHECLARSQANQDAEWWPAVYKAAFPNMVSIQKITSDGWAQRGGIDRIVILRSGKTLTVDEKVRAKSYDDILLERWSNTERKSPGWIQQALACDYIAYAIIPTKTCYMLPFQQLRVAWIRNGREWIVKYPEIKAVNKGYVTTSVAVPVGVLMGAIQDAMTVSWSGQEPYDPQKHETTYVNQGRLFE